MVLLAGGKSWDSTNGVTTGFETSFTCTAVVSAGTDGDTWYSSKGSLARIDGGTSNNSGPYESYLMSGLSESALTNT